MRWTCNIILTNKQERPTLTARNFPVLVVDYDDAVELQHALLGVDVVISTVTGNPQIALIHAAAANGVSRFAPAEFGSLPSASSEPQSDPLDRGRAYATVLLEHYKNTQGMEYTLFICGILYERFAPGGLYQYALALQAAAAGEGDYILNVRNMTAEAPIWDSDNELVELCLTSAQDVAKFVVEALGMRHWPVLLTMSGERMTVQELVALVEQVRGESLPHAGMSVLHTNMTLHQACKCSRMYITTWLLCNLNSSSLRHYRTRPDRREQSIT